MRLLNKVRKFIEANQLFGPEDKLLVGFSGGADSIVLLDVLLRMGYDCIAAHCNFQLRGEESDRDEQFVTSFCRERYIQLEKVRFDTTAYALENKISIEMAARDLRYSWFEKIAEKKQADWIAVGHHADDSAETLLLNLIRGTGIKGLSGIDAKRGKIVRPILDTTREEIENYARHFGLSYVTDSTNETSQYVRNKIRNEIIPLMAELNPSMRKTLHENSKRFAGMWRIYEEKVKEIEAEILNKTEQPHSIDIQKLQAQADPKTLLYELLSQYGFTSDTSSKVTSLLNDSGVGKVFHSNTHNLIIDREQLLIEETGKTDENVFTIEAGVNETGDPINLRFRTFEKEIDFSPSRKSHIVHFDADKVKFPLKLRKWQEGDFFVPFGMKGRKKLSDFFVDQKLSLIDKKNIWLLTSEENIIWIVGHRTDDRYKIDSKTHSILEIKTIEEK